MNFSVTPSAGFQSLNKIRSILIVWGTTCLVTGIVPRLLFAQDPPADCAGADQNDPEKCLVNPIDAPDLFAVVQTVINWLTAILVPLGIIYIVFAGFRFVFAGGKSSELQNAKKTLRNVIIGLALILGAQVISAMLRIAFESL